MGSKVSKKKSSKKEWPKKKCKPTPSTSNDNDGGITLGSLPPDIVRMIIRMEGWRVEHVRLISPMWNKLVTEGKLDVDSLQIISTKAASLTLALYLSPQNAKKCANWPNDWHRQQNDGHSPLWRTWRLQAKAHGTDANVSRQIARVLQKFRTIDKIGIPTASERIRRILVAALRPNIVLHDVIMGDSVLNNDLLNFTMDIAKRAPVKCLRISAEKRIISPCDLKDYLFGISKLVTSFYLVQSSVRSNEDRTKMFDMLNKYWTIMAREMVVRGIWEIYFIREDRTIASAWSHMKHIMYYWEP